MKKIFYLVMVVLIISCSKNDDELKPAQSDDSQIQLKGAYIGPNKFDWENETFIKWNGKDIYLPWASGASGAIPLEVKNDWNSKEGWTLLYNNFPKGSADPVFILYNKFKGIVRVFMYVTNTTYISSSFTWGFGAHTLNCNTATFNFTKAVPEPLNVKHSNPNVYNANWTNDANVIPNGVVPNEWYYSDFEVMYDPNISNLSHNDIELCISSFCTNKQYIKLEGTIDGKLEGTISLPSEGSTSGIFSDMVKGFDIEKVGKVNFPTLADSKKFLQSYAAKQANAQLKSLFMKGLTSLSSSLATSNPIIKAITGGLFSTSPSSPGKISCSLKAKTAQSGSITSITPGPSVSFLFPGSKQSNKGGLLPNYTKPLGVFCLKDKPQVDWKYQIIAVPPLWNGIKRYIILSRLSVDNSVDVIINPEVTKSCSKVEVKKQIVYLDPVVGNETMNDAELIDSYDYKYKYLSNGISLTKKNEVMGNGFPLSPPTKAPKCVVRITVSMTPIGMTDPIVVVKEFEPKVVKK